MENIYNKILKLKEDTCKITSNPELDRIDLELIRKFENIPQYKSKLNVVWENIKDSSYIFTEKHKAAFDAYNELVILEYLNLKLPTELVPEKKRKKTPDYKIYINNENYIYCDLKTLHYFQNNINYTEIQDNSTLTY